MVVTLTRIAHSPSDRWVCQEAYSPEDDECFLDTDDPSVEKSPEAILWQYVLCTL